MPKNYTLLDLGCGTGIPISKILMEEGMHVYGIDASPAMVISFRKNFPNTPIVCEAKWKDAMTNQLLLSPGAARYKEILTASRLSLIEEFEDEGGNHYYHSVKI